MLNTIEQAKSILQDESKSEKERVEAAHYLGKHGNKEVANLLVSALDDDDYGIHWAASEGLAYLGDAAMPALLKALVNPDCSPRMIHGAKHVFHTSSSVNVRKETANLLHTMHGSAQEIAIMQAASELMTTLRIA